jgi:hypothetical protein
MARDLVVAARQSPARSCCGRSAPPPEAGERRARPAAVPATCHAAVAAGGELLIPTVMLGRWATDGSPERGPSALPGANTVG